MVWRLPKIFTVVLIPISIGKLMEGLKYISVSPLWSEKKRDCDIMRRGGILKRTVVAATGLGLLLTIVSAIGDDSIGKCLGSWTLATADTRLTVGATDKGQLCIYNLSNPVAGWNWTAQPSELPLINKVTVNGEVHDIQWEFQDGVMDNTNGQEVTLRFVCAQPAMELTSTWQAHPGRGPVRHTMFIKNNSGGVVTLGEQETFDIHVAGPGTNANVWYFNDDRGIPDPTGVYCDPLTRGYQKTLPVTSMGSDWISYVVISNSECGIYLGWEWSNGRMEVSADSTSGGARLKMGNGDNFRTDLAAGETFEVPPGFIGAYAGDLDDAGNSVRRYLFNYNLPEMLKTNTNYPEVEWNAFAATGKGQGSWDPTETKYYPFIDDIVPLGFEEVVIDIGWWSSYGKPDPGHIVTDTNDWPSGMAAAQYAHDRGLRFGLYDNQTEDLTSESGKQEYINDITYLLKDLHADFYRSDATAGPTIQGNMVPGNGPIIRRMFSIGRPRGFTRPSTRGMRSFQVFRGKIARMVEPSRTSALCDGRRKF